MDFSNLITNVTSLKSIFLICGFFIVIDIITGYLKAFKTKKINSSISRDGFIKKIGWVLALITGVFIEYISGTRIVLITSATMCILTEGISFYENLGELGVNVPYKKYFEKICEKEEGEDDA